MAKKTIAVTGATGQQGGAVVRHMLKAGWQVRALTRDTGKPAAAALAQMGAEIVKADNDDLAALTAAFKGADAVFAVQNYWLPNVGKDGEIRQGKLAADAAKAVGTPHFIYSSVGAAHRGMGQKHFESKFEIEGYIKSLKLPFTIIRPVAFMENVNRSRVAISNGSYPAMGLPPTKRSQTIAVDDIGLFVAHILAHPEKYVGRTIEFAGDELTEQETAEALGKVIGRPVKLARREAPAGAAPNPEMAAMFTFFSGEAYDADIAALRRELPGLQSYETFLRRNGWEGLKPMAESQLPAWGG
jgi:uncharacterized protein YbjT (DUF2867 family)